MKSLAITVLIIIFAWCTTTFGYGLGQYYSAQENSIQNGLVAALIYNSKNENPDYFSQHQIKFGLESYIRLRNEYSTVLGRVFLGKMPAECGSEYEVIKKYIAEHPEMEWGIEEKPQNNSEVPASFAVFYYFHKVFGTPESEIERQYKEELSNILSLNKSLKVAP